MNLTVLDCETTISNKGNPFDQTNKLCVVGVYSSLMDDSQVYKIEYDNEPYGDNLRNLQSLLATTNLLILFNGKFDMNWLVRYGIILPKTLRVWDTQFFEHFASNMNWIYPDLEQSCSRRGVTGDKLHTIEEYWDAGIDTPQIPFSIIEKRVLSDVELTYQLYLKQLEEYNTWSKPRQNLFRLQCQDLLVLQQIEFNGFYYDEEASKAEAETTLSTLLDIEKQIFSILNYQINIWKPNLNSDEHLSALLYGGSIRYKSQEQIGIYKSGAKVNQPRYKWVETEVAYPRLVEPLEGSTCEKEGVWSTDKKVLGNLLRKKLSKQVREFIVLIMKRSETARCLSTYLDGLPKLIEKMHWPRNMLHGTLNQVVARTGRLSSSKPNLQNFDGSLKHLFRSRYD